MVKHGNEENFSYTFVTNNADNDASTATYFLNKYERNGEKVLHMLHNHPNSKKVSDSNMAEFADSSPSAEDLITASDHPETVFFVYNQVNSLIQFYNGKGIYKTQKLHIKY